MAFRDVLAASPSVALEPVEFDLGSERFAANMRLDFDGTDLPPAAELELAASDPLFVVQRVSGSGDVQVSAALARAIAVSSLRNQLQDSLPPDAGVTPAELDEAAAAQADLLLVSFEQQGLVERRDGMLVAELEFADGALTVNGRPLGLPAPGGATPLPGGLQGRAGP